MPVCPPKTPEQRQRWEYVMGKALKDWVTRVMEKDHLTRVQARERVLSQIQKLDVVPECSGEGYCHLHGFVHYEY